MNGLERQYSDRVDFFVLDVDKPESLTYLDRFAIRSRSTYVLIDAQGNELARWFGPLDGRDVATEMETILAALDS